MKTGKCGAQNTGESVVVCARTDVRRKSLRSVFRVALLCIGTEQPHSHCTPSAPFPIPVPSYQQYSLVKPGNSCSKTGRGCRGQDPVLAPSHEFNKKISRFIFPEMITGKYNTAPDRSTGNSRAKKSEEKCNPKKVKLFHRRILFLLCCGLLCRCLLYRLLCRRFLCCCHEFSTSYRKGLYFFSICELINILVATGFSRIESL